MKQVTIYTDGACIGNPGPGGYGAVILFCKYRKEISGGYRKTTNNRMEILAVIRALETLNEPCVVTLHSDSEYVVNAMSKGWATNWKAQGWKRGRQGRAKNPDLWERLLDLASTHRVTFKWIRGHAGNVENERCDKLATQAARGKNLVVDAGYESAKSAMK